MNTDGPDKFDQFMGWTRETGETIGEGLQWLTLHVEEVAVMSAAPIVLLTVWIIHRARKRNSEALVMRHARRR